MPPIVTVASPIESVLPTAKAKPVEQGALSQNDGGVAPDGVGLVRIDDRDVAIERIGVIDGLDLDQRALAGGAPCHGAERRRFAQVAERLERRPLFRVGLAVDQLEGKIAADQEPALPRQRLVEGGRERADRRHGRDAKSDAEHEHGKPARARAEFAQRHGESELQVEARGGLAGARARHDAATLRLTPLTMRPSARLTIRSQRLASERS